MPLLPRLSSLMRNVFRREAVDGELDRELHAYLDLLSDEKIKAGLPAEAARREALLDLGGLEQVKEDVRDARIGSLVESLFQDLRYALRTLARSPGFTAVALLSLALGIGGTAAMFSLVYGVLVRPLPYPEPDRLVRVTGVYPRGAVVALQERSRTLDLAAYTTDSEFNLTGQGAALRLPGRAVTANLFSVLGARAALGRTFTSGEDRPGRDRVVLLSHALWQSKFSADPAILGRFLAIDGVEREVVGVMPSGFAFPASAQLWIPLHLDASRPDEYWGANWIPLLARLRPGATLTQARNEIRPLIASIIPLFPWSVSPSWNADAAAIRLQQDMVRDVRGRLLVLLAAVALVLLIACANVASLLLARAAARRKEIALRGSLGAGRGRIVRQLLTESVTLAFGGAALGLLLAYSGLSVLKAALPADTPGLASVSIDWRVLSFVAALAILTGLGFGLAPALSVSRLNLVEAVRAAGQRAAGVASVRLRGAFIAGEVALAVVLVVAAGLLIRTLWELSQVDPGFRSERIVTIRVSPAESSCRDGTACVNVYEELIRRARALSGVAGVAAVNALPLSGQIPALPVEFEGHPVVAGQTDYALLWGGAVTPDYFRVLRVPLLRGRGFTPADSERSSPVVIVSAATARRFWPGQDPLGKHVRLAWDRDLWRAVVGVVADVRQYDLANHAPAGFSGTLYMPYPQSLAIGTATDRQIPSTMSLLLATGSDPRRVGDDVARLVSDLNPNVPASGLATVADLVSASASPSRSLMWLFVAFAGSALLLALIGTYGVVSYSAAQRTYEMGVRVALGARPAGLFALVLGHSIRLVLAGLTIGVIASLALTRLLARFLYGVSANDPLTLLAVSLLLLLIALLAGYFPARRAAAVDPLTALRVD